MTQEPKTTETTGRSIPSKEEWEKFGKEAIKRFPKTLDHLSKN